MQPKQPETHSLKHGKYSNMQEQVTIKLFNVVSTGDIESLQREQKALGLKQPDDIAVLLDA